MIKIVRNALHLPNSVRHFKTKAKRSRFDVVRPSQRLEVNPNSQGPLLDLPDYTFLDGRPTPLGVHQYDRLMHQREIAAKIVRLTSEVDNAKVRCQQMKIDKQQEKEAIIQNKFKPKGHLLLKK